MRQKAPKKCVLGLDLGTNSVGWALLEEGRDGPERIVDLGVRIFEAGVEGDIESGKDESRAKARRDARLVRRQTERRSRRRRKTACLLQRHGLLPKGGLKQDSSRDAIIKSFDADVYLKYAAAVRKKKKDILQTLDQLPYFLRARALDEPLEPFELGRAFYHLSQRRGFLSNRKAPTKDGEEEGQVKQGISELAQEIEQSGARTLGEYFAGLDPHEHRIRKRWTARTMYEQEFEAIWTAQAKHHPKILTAAFKKQLYKSIFRQRPLKSQKGLVGRCELEEGARRAPWASFIAQRFRLLQKVNDLKIVGPAPFFEERGLSPEERTLLIDLLAQTGDAEFTKIRKELGLERGSTFNLERGGEKKLKGDTTTARLRGVFGGRWDALTEDQKEAVLHDVYSIQNEKALASRGVRAWKLSKADAEKLSKTAIEEGYCSLSRKAIERMLPEMEQGVPYATARLHAYPGRDRSIPVGRLPYIDDRDNVNIELRNPAVHRVLSETRKVVNAILDKHGLPGCIRIELARDLKKSRSDRAEIWKKNRQNEQLREKARAKIIKEAVIPQPSREDILRVQLAEECDWTCPYTGKHISMKALVGKDSQFDIEHIIPYSRCLDNSFTNKTLCYHEENRNRKQNKTPQEAYTPDEMDAIVARVKSFKGDRRAVAAKLGRFLTTSLDAFDTFSNRQLNDTRYASTLAAQYLGMLYGGQIDANDTRRIQAGRGQVTSDLRMAWGLNGILGDGGTKTRDDHRHHAIDAVAIALTDAKTVKALSTANSKGYAEGRRNWWKNVPQPWDGFLTELTEAVNGIVVSHRVSRKVNGPMHDETNYGKPYMDDKDKPCCHVRKPLASLSANRIDDIVDPVVRQAVRRKLEELGGDPAKAFKDEQNLPYLTTHDGRKIPIRKARIRVVASAKTIGKGSRERHVLLNANHHAEIIEITDKKGNAKWDDIIVDRYTAMRRLLKHEPIIQHEHGEGKRFVMSLTQGDVLLIKDDDDNEQLVIVRSVSKKDYCFVRLTEARLKKDIVAAGKWVRFQSFSLFQSRFIKKLHLTPLGEMRDSND